MPGIMGPARRGQRTNQAAAIASRPDGVAQVPPGASVSGHPRARRCDLRPRTDAPKVRETASYHPPVDRLRLLLAIRTGTIVVVVAAIVAQAIELVNAGAFDASRFFAFFTIQSNLIGVAVFAWLIARRGKPSDRRTDLLRGASVVYLTVTFVVVIVLLGNVDVQLQLAWVDFVLHKLFPIVMIAGLAHRSARDPTRPSGRIDLARLSAGLDGAHPHPGCHRRLVSLSIPRSRAMADTAVCWSWPWASQPASSSSPRSRSRPVTRAAGSTAQLTVRQGESVARVDPDRGQDRPDMEEGRSSGGAPPLRLRRLMPTM